MQTKEKATERKVAKKRRAKKDKSRILRSERTQNISRHESGLKIKEKKFKN